MRLSHESSVQRVSVLFAVWIAIAVLLVQHSIAIRDYLGVSASLGLRGQPTAPTPLKAAYPAFAADAQTWVRHALTLLEGDQIRLRHTDIDNAPFGREVHWNSAWAWTIAGAGKLDHWVTGRPITESVERVTLWLPGLALMVLIVLLSWWTAKRGGLLAGVIVAIALVGQARIYEGFFPSYVDHHGLITASTFAMVLGAVFMGSGWWMPRAEKEIGILPTSAESARSAAVFSGLGGAFGMWIGAASVIPTIAFVGIAGVGVSLFLGKKALARGERFDGSVWRRWGASGALGSLGFYLLEYAPNHFGLRLEVNHPFYALAWWGAGELIACVSELWLGQSKLQDVRWGRVGLAVAAALAAPLTILIGRESVFVVMDPFLSDLHNKHIQEFLPLWKTINRNGWVAALDIALVDNLPLITTCALLLTARARIPTVVWFAAGVVAMGIALAWWQARWLLNASGPQVCLVLLLVGLIPGRMPAVLRWLAAMVVCVGLYGYQAVTRVRGAQADAKARRVSPSDANSALFRDVARVIRSSQPEGEIVLVSSPNSSTGIGYYGRFKTLGTLYWENNDGLKAAGKILSARSTAEAAELIKQHKVTHIAILSEENFVGPYFQLLNPKAPAEDLKKTFGYQLLIDKVVPVWLRTIPYRVPDDLKSLNVSVLILQVAFGQTSADALYHIALTKIEMGDIAQAEADLDRLIVDVPAAPQPWLRKAELLLNRQAWAQAADATINGIQRAGQKERSGLFSAAAANFYRLGRSAEAAKLYRAALEDAFDPNAAAYLSWVLSTSRVDEVRNGKEALIWAERALAADRSSPTFLNSYAAALAELGRFDDAKAAAQTALATAERLGDVPTAKVTRIRLESFSARRPWRE